MIEDIAEKIVKIQQKSPKLFVFSFIIITILFIPGILNLVNNVEPSLEKVLPQKIEEIKTMNQMREQFGADMIYLLIYPQMPVSDVRDPKLLVYMDLIKQKVRGNEYIIEVNTLADLVKDSNNNVIPNSIKETRELLKNNDFVKRYSNSAYSLSVIEIKSDTGSSAELIKYVVDSLKNDIEDLEEFNPGAKIEMTGFNVIDKATFEIIMSDFSSITIVSMILIMIIVFITFGSFTKGMLPMVVVIISLTWTMGIVGYLGLTITVVSMVAAAMIMGLGIDFGIHVVHNYFEKKKKMKREKAMKETMKELLRAMIGASLTTSAGFLALLFGVLPAMKILGIILGLGIIFTLIGASLLLPVIIYLYDGGEFK